MIISGDSASQSVGSRGVPSGTLSDPLILPSSTKLKIKSDNFNDANPMEGARRVKISGLDASFNYLEETVALAGENLAETVNSYSFVLSAEVVEVGNYLGNVGRISIGMQVFVFIELCAIPPYAMKAPICRYFVPAGQEADLNHAGASGDALFVLRQWDGSVFRTLAHFRNSSAEIDRTVDGPVMLDMYCTSADSTDPLHCYLDIN